MTISRTLLMTGNEKATFLRSSSLIVMSPAAMSPSPTSSVSNSLSRDTGVNGTVNGRAPSAKVLLTHPSKSCAPLAAVP